MDKSCLLKGSAVEYLALTFLYVAKILPFLEATEGVITTRKALPSTRLTFLLEEFKTQSYCLKNLLSFLNQGIKVPRSCRGPWKNGTSKPYLLRLFPLPNECNILQNLEDVLHCQKKIRELRRRPDSQPCFPTISSIQQAWNVLSKLSPLRSHCCKPEDDVFASSSSWSHSCPLLTWKGVFPRTWNKRKRQTNVLL